MSGRQTTENLRASTIEYFARTTEVEKQTKIAGAL
jgi:hypothetical protein